MRAAKRSAVDAKIAQVFNNLARATTPLEAPDIGFEHRVLKHRWSEDIALLQAEQNFLFGEADKGTPGLPDTSDEAASTTAHKISN